MPLVINSLGGGHTHTHTSILTSRTKVISRNQACTSWRPAHAWFKNSKFSIISSASQLASLPDSQPAIRSSSTSATVQLNYNFIFACMYMCGTMRKLQCHPVTCLRGPCFLVACIVHVTCWNMRGTKFTHVEQKIHTRTYIHVNYSPDTTRSVFNTASNLPNYCSMCSELPCKYLVIYCHRLQTSRHAR